MIQHNHIRAWPAAGPSPAQGTKAGTGCKLLLLLHPVHRSLHSTVSTQESCSLVWPPTTGGLSADDVILRPRTELGTIAISGFCQ